MADDFLKKNKKFHYNYEKEIYYKVSSGSHLLDLELEGGFCPGIHRFTGINEGGKTSSALAVMKNFLAMPNARAIYFKTEGRLGPEMRERAGVTFVFDPKEWVDGTCLVFECNIYETVASFIRELIDKNEEGKLYNFLIDSMDGLIPEADLDRPFADASKVAGGAVISSALMKKVGIPLPKFGHMAVLISQVRADIKLDPYSKVPIRQTTATGGNALLHYANWILEFEPRFKKDLILENNKEAYNSLTNKILGHYAKATIKKSPNEKTNNVVSYPICHGRKNGTSVWNEKEIGDMLIIWGLVTKKGGWFYFDADLINEALEAGVELAEKVQGMPNLHKLIEDDKKIGSFLVGLLNKMNSEEEDGIQDDPGHTEEAEAA